MAGSKRKKYKKRIKEGKFAEKEEMKATEAAKYLSKARELHKKGEIDDKKMKDIQKSFQEAKEKGKIREIGKGSFNPPKKAREGFRNIMKEKERSKESILMDNAKEINEKLEKGELTHEDLQKAFKKANEKRKELSEWDEEFLEHAHELALMLKETGKKKKE